MDQEILNKLLENTFTATLLKHRLRILKTILLKNLFGGEAQTEQLVPRDMDWLNSLSPAFVQQFNKDNVYQIFNDIEAKLKSIPVLIIYLPFDANDQTIYQIGSFIRKTFNNLYLFDNKFNPELIAGCALSWKGHYQDYSLKAKLTEKKEQILENFRKFLK